MDWFQDRRRIFYLLLALGLFLFFFRLGDRPFRDPDEGRYAHIAWQMITSGDWLAPRIFGIDYLRKPPLFYWLIAGSFKLFGQGEWQARMVPALFGFAAVPAIYFFTLRFFGARSAAFAALFLLANPWHVNVSRFLVIDTVFSFFVVASFYLFFLALSAEKEKKTLYYSLFYAAVALAFLAKGVLAVVLPGLTVFVYGLSTRRFWKIVREMRLVLGAGIFLAIAAPWFVWMTQNKPGFWNVFFVREHLSRFAAKEFEHQEAWWFYFALMFAFFLPWLLVPGPVKTAARSSRDGAGKFLFVWTAATVVFLSLSKSKLATYLMPAIPPVCVLLGDAYARWTQGHPARLKAFVLVMAVLMVSVAPLAMVMEAKNRDFTTKHFAETLKPRLSPGDEIYVYDHPGPFYDFSFYLDRPVRPVGLHGELEITRGDETAEEVAVAQGEFKALMNGGTHFYCLMRRSDWRDLPADLRARLGVLAEDNRKVLFESGEKK